MTQKTESTRDTISLFVERTTGADEFARITARNALRQFDAVIDLINEGLRSAGSFKLRPSMIMELNRLATQSIDPDAGQYRVHLITISNSSHVPPQPEEVPRHIEDVCEYVNANWIDCSAIHLSAYLLWRLNWIQPFKDGNGRTARAISYAVLCIRLGYILPGGEPVPARIANDRLAYYVALDAADEAFREGRTDVSVMEGYLADKLTEQLFDTPKAVVSEAG